MATEKEKLIKQIPYRIHLHEKALLMQLLENEGIKFQQLMDAFIESYMRGDKPALQIVKLWKDMYLVPDELKDRYMLSQRERSEILSELEEKPQVRCDAVEKGPGAAHCELPKGHQGYHSEGGYSFA